MSILEKIFGDANQRFLDTLKLVIEEINSLEPTLEKLSREELKNRTIELKQRYQKENDLETLLPEAFALVREASKRTLKQRHFDVQLIGGLVLHQGQIAEMRTGEGKTLTATLPLFLNALTGKGCHLITVNDYLAKRDTVWMGQIFNYLGLTVSCLQHENAFIYDENVQLSQEEEQTRDQGIKVQEKFLRQVQRKEAYQADITYGTNNEFGFDYLRDNMAVSLEQTVQRELNFAIVDEVDSVLIDEARTPLIISAPAEESTEKYYQFAQLVKNLRSGIDYNIDEKMKACTLTEEGIISVEKTLGVDNIYQSHGISTVHHLEEALKAEALFKLDRDYVIKDGEVIIVDEFTGRLMIGRRYSGGLHQAIEAKENVKIQRESITMATVTFQNYFRMYKKLAGMTGTAATESEEFSKIYNLDVTIIPTNKPMVRKDLNDSIYKTERGKFKAIVEEIKKRNGLGQPVLVGTISIEKNEFLSELLNQEGIKHQLLNAKNHEKEALIISQAGKLSAVTIATNMAGRGVDIILGGNPADPAEAEKVRKLGGLLVIGSERHESRRIDNQLRGRSGRQGDPGASRFFISVEDDLMRIFGSDRMKSLMNTLGVPEDLPIENKLISKSIESAQKKVEGYNFDIRKHLVEYDDVLNKQREVIYTKRRQILQTTQVASEKSSKTMILEMLAKEAVQLVNFHFTSPDQKDTNEIIENLLTIYPFTAEEQKLISQSLTKDTDQAIAFIQQLINEKYDQMEKQFNALPQFSDLPEPLRMVEKQLLLRSMDSLWVEHLEVIEHLRTGIGLRGYGQRDPLVEYKKESFSLFQQLLDAIQDQVVHNIFKLGLTSPTILANQQAQKTKEVKSAFGPFGQAKQSSEKQVVVSKPKDATGHKVGRNDPCPCGSGKKYKKCHGM